MKYLLVIIFVSVIVVRVNSQLIDSLFFGKNTLKGKVILKDLIHPVKETKIKNALILKLYKKIKFKATNELEENVVTDEIRIYGDVTKNDNPNLKYKTLINKNVIITANIVYAPSGNYPLLANIIEDFHYAIIH